MQGEGVEVVDSMVSETFVRAIKCTFGIWLRLAPYYYLEREPCTMTLVGHSSWLSSAHKDDTGTVHSVHVAAIWSARASYIFCFLLFALLTKHQRNTSRPRSKKQLYVSCLCDLLCRLALSKTRRFDTLHDHEFNL